MLLEKPNRAGYSKLLCYPCWGRPMRWLMIAFLLSLGALLFAAAGMARHIWLQRAKLRSRPSQALEAAEESDIELKR